MTYLDAHRKVFGVEPICRTVTEAGGIAVIAGVPVAESVVVS